MNPNWTLPMFRRPVAALAAATALTATTLALALPAAAHATGAVTYDGTTVTFTGDAAADQISISGNDVDHRLWLNTSGLSSIPAECEYGFSYQAVCPMPQRIVLRLGDGDDNASVSYGTFDAIPSTTTVELYGEGGKDRLQSAPLLDGGPGDDRLEGYEGSQLLRGGPGDDDLSGGLGADELRGDDGNDLLSGDGYKDPSADVLDGGAGQDRIEIEWTQGEKLNVPVSVTLDGVADDGRAGEGDNVISIERITTLSPGLFVGTDGPDSFDVQPATDRGPTVVQGRGGNDTIVGDDDVEQLDGGPGDDYLEGGYSDDTIVGGPGRDRVFADETGAACWAYGSCTLPFGNDTIDVRDGEVDQVDCGIGNDTVKADPQDVLSGCEVVDSGPAPAPRPERVVERGRARGPAAKALALTVGGAKLGAALRDGLVVRVAAPGAGRLAATLTRGRATVASGAARARRGGMVAVRVRFTKAARRALRRSRSAQLAVTVRFVPKGGGPARSGAGAVRLKR